MATIEMVDVKKEFGGFTAVKPLNLRIEDGEFAVFLGPSGCGKTTTMRMISGLESVTSGNIYLDGENVTWTNPADRNIAFVFQFFALYPHMSVEENILFPLKAEHASRDIQKRKLEEMIDLLRIDRALLPRRPGALSGGDKQRITLARALVREPSVFLMDEPLGALDAEFRERMRAEIRRLQIQSGVTTVYVTHDQIEAMAMGDRIVVMSAAEIQQVGSPADVYYDPANLFVATFIGSPGMNLLYGRYAHGIVHLFEGSEIAAPTAWKPILDEEIGTDNEVVVGFRPEAAQLTDDGGIKSEVYSTDIYGAYSMLAVNPPNAKSADIAQLRSDRLLDYPIGTIVNFDINPNMIRFFDPQTELALTKPE